MKKVGTLIIILGIGIFILTSFPSFGRSKVAALENTEVAGNKPQSYRWYPMVGIAVLGIGAIILSKSSTK